VNGVIRMLMSLCRWFWWTMSSVGAAKVCSWSYEPSLWRVNDKKYRNEISLKPISAKIVRQCLSNQNTYKRNKTRIFQTRINKISHVSIWIIRQLTWLLKNRKHTKFSHQSNFCGEAEEEIVAYAKKSLIDHMRLCVNRKWMNNDSIFCFNMQMNELGFDTLQYRKFIQNSLVCRADFLTWNYREPDMST
jgi:hypothetical protein